MTITATLVAIALAVLASSPVLAGQAYQPLFMSPSPLPTCSAATEKLHWSGAAWQCQPDATGAAAGLPSGLITLIFSGQCASGWSEVTALNGVMLRGTVAANNDVGTTGGADTITPAGTVAAPSFTGTAATLTHSGTAVADHSYTPAGTNSGAAVSAHAGTNVTLSSHSGTAVADHPSHTHTVTSNVSAADHTINQVVNHTHTVTVNDPGHAHNQRSQTATTGSASSWEHGAIDTSSTAAETLPTDTAATGITATTANPAGGVASITLQHALTNNQVTSGGPSATLTHAVTQPSDHTVTVTQPSDHTVTQATFAGTPATLPHTVTQPSAHSYTPAGEISAPSFSGTAFDNRPAFKRVIFCAKD